PLPALHMDQNRRRHPRTRHPQTSKDFIHTTLGRSLHMLAAAVRILEFRKDNGGYVDPSPEKPALIIGIEEAHRLLRESPEAASLCLQILRHGANGGVSLYLTLPDVDLGSLGGDAELQAELVANDDHCKFFMGESGLQMYRDAVKIRKGQPKLDPFEQ
ncbi:hypothetical protein AB0M29_37730, partial [Streptomyces sp. NPDC051976]|uniref:hypothetical protein n=1 Tax=Streptomyces sp. NPDC051976 TaxID=3154947 RepID=UPI0034373953